MSSTPEKPDLSALSDRYEIVGEVGGRDHTRSYVGTRKTDGRDVQITVMRAAADVAEGKAIAQFAADANLLATLSHPNVPQVLEGRWIGDDAFALVNDRIHGTTLAEMMAGDRLPNPQIADILSDVDGVLEWARGERIVHRGVTPAGVLIERGTGKVYVSLSPADAPKTNRPDARDDARTIGMLAKALLAAKPMAEDHDGTLMTMRPDLPRRVVDVTDKMATITINDEQPNVAAYLASVAMADAIKEGELEVARVDAEFRAAMKAEREKWEAEQKAWQLANEEQARKFAEERAEYDRRSAKEREQLAAARIEIDKRRAEVQQARAELDLARADFKNRKSELEARVKEIDRHARDLEKQKKDLERHSRELEKRKLDLERRNKELQDAAVVAAAGAVASGTSMDSLKARLTQPLDRVDELKRPTVPVDVAATFNRPTVPVDQVVEGQVDEPEIEPDIEAEEAIAASGLGTGVESIEDVHEPWTPIEEHDPWAVPLETEAPVGAIKYEAAAIPEPPDKSGRPRWVVPAGVAGFLILLIGGAVAINRHASSNVEVASAVPAAARRAPDTAAVPSAPITDSAAGVIASAALPDSDEFTAIRDSIAEVDAQLRAERQKRLAVAAAAEKARAAATTVTDSNGVKWTTLPPPPLDSVKRALQNSPASADSIARARAARRDSTARKDTTKVKRDTTVKPDTGRVTP